MLQYEQKVIRVDDMERFVNKNLFWIVFLLVQIFHKGILFILQKLNLNRLKERVSQLHME